MNDCSNPNATLEILQKARDKDQSLEVHFLGGITLLGTNSLDKIIDALEFKKQIGNKFNKNALNYLEKKALENTKEVDEQLYYAVTQLRKTLMLPTDKELTKLKESKK